MAEVSVRGLALERNMAARSSSLSRGAVVTSFSPSVMLVTRPLDVVRF